MTKSSKDAKKTESKPKANKEVVVKLKHPFTSLGKEFKELRLRKPNGAEVRDIGFPISAGGKTGKKVQIDTGMCMEYIEVINELSEGDANLIDFDDLNNAILIIADFFGSSL